MSERDECCPRRDVSSAVREGTYLVPWIGTLISKADLGMILLSVVQKMVGYDCPTDDRKKAVEAFVLGKDVFIIIASNVAFCAFQESSAPHLPAVMIPLILAQSAYRH